MKKNLSLLEQELKNNAKEVENSGNKIDSLAKKQTTIQTAIQQTKKIMEEYNKKLTENTDKLEQQQKKLSELEKSRAEAKQTYEDLVKTQGKEAEATQQAKENYDKLDQQYKNTSKSIENTKKAIQGNVSEITKLEGKQLDLESQLKQTAKAIEDESDKFAKASEKFVETGQNFEKAGGKISEVSGTVGTIGVGLMTAVSGLGALALEMDNSFAGLGGKIGATAEETERLREIALNLYENGFGESLDDCINDIVLLQQNIKGASELTDEEKTKLLEYMNNIKSLFGATSEELTRTVNNMLQNGIVDSAEEAFDVITVGFQNGLNSGGDFLDVLYEYSPQFKKLGITGKGALELIKAGLDNGAYNADKMADSIKEFSIRAIDGSDSTIDAFNSLGFSADDMMNKFGEGGDTARQAFDEVLTALKGIQDPIEQDRIGVELFGRW